MGRWKCENGKRGNMWQGWKTRHHTARLENSRTGKRGSDEVWKAKRNFSRRKIPRSSAHAMGLSEKAIRFRHPDYNPDRAQQLISSSMSRHLSTRNISSKSMHAFLSSLANRQTDKHGLKHLPPPLSEVTSRVYFSTRSTRKKWKLSEIYAKK